MTANRLSKRIQEAERLVFVFDGDCGAVGALKNPEEGYKAAVFNKAGVPAEAANYNYELGWLYVAKAARGKGVGHILMKSVLRFLEGSGCYATTRENNDAMRHLLPMSSFKQIGQPYQGSGGYRLVLYAK